MTTNMQKIVSRNIRKIIRNRNGEKEAYRNDEKQKTDVYIDFDSRNCHRDFYDTSILPYEIKKQDTSNESSVGVQKATRSMKGIFPLFRRYFHSAYVLVRVAQVP